MIPFGHLCSVALLGVLLFAPRICGHFKNHWWWYTKVIGLIIAAGLLLQAMIISQTRASWLAAMLVLPVVLIFYLFPEIKSGDYRKKIASGALLTIVAVGILVSMNYQVISSRMAVANDELQSIVNNGHVGSVGARYYLWVYGLDKWAESPLVGWGNSAVVLKMPENSDIYQLTHLHNTYIEVMVQGGIIALGLFLTAIFIVARSLYSVHRRRLVSRDVCAFLAGTLAILLIWMFADYEVFLSRFRFFVVVMLGLMFSYYFVGASEKENKRTSAGTTGSIKES
jgi:O-antigen ligase